MNKKEILQILENTDFNSKMAMKKAGHVGLLVMAKYLEHKNKNKEDKVPRFVMSLAFVLLMLDEIECLGYAIKKMRKGK